ncbi:unnamed protein product [Phaedon cochleariae]|uniref:DUF4806 domain-containing protein n=1 Tax=Phaedon cochleariae TaxID=80249 RepID=A0A9P0DLN5_PHACE|nr:unnamed protein product [Phaedon cochleariae]
MAATWTVVKFITDNSVEAVPSKWLSDGKCSWPSYTRDRLMKAIRTCEPPLSCWNQHEIIPFRNATYNNYATARKKSMKAEETSDLNSENEKTKRVLKKPKIFSADSDEVSDDSSADSISDLGIINHEFPQIQIQSSGTTEHESPNNHGSTNTLAEELSRELSSDITTNVGIDKCTCCVIHKHEAANNSGYFKQIIRKLTILEMDMCDLKKIIDRSPVSTILEIQNIWAEFEFPLSTIEVLTSFEEFLSDEENMKKSITELSKVGGDNPNDFMKRAMTKLMTPKLAAEYSWVGLKKKKIFSKMHISHLLIRSAQQNGKTSSFTIKELEDGIKKVLRRANERAMAEEKKLSK